MLDKETPEPESKRPIHHNLPAQPTPFIGREKELAELDALITDPQTRLVTIVGPGGMGKTRLALAVAQAQLDTQPDAETGVRFPDGVFFVPLAALNEVEQMFPAMAEAFNVQLQSGERTSQQQILAFMRQKQMLVILDNFEQLTEGAGVLAEILEAAPGVKLLVTSRERLQLHAEQLFPIQGLAFAAAVSDKTPEPLRDATAYAAGQLFLQFAPRNAPDFSLRDENDLAHLAQICRLLAGMPLAIELAAAWVDTLSLAEIAAEIQQGLDFLETDRRDAPARHRSMHAAMEASWQRLDEKERDIFAQLSIFREGFTRQAAKEVAGADLRVLSRLLHKSFLQYDRARERYQIHELMRRFGLEKLGEDQNEETAARDRHCAFYCQQLAERERELWLSQPFITWVHLEADFHNFEAAWQWAIRRRLFKSLHYSIQTLFPYYTYNNRWNQGIRLSQWSISQLAPEDVAEIQDAYLAWIVSRILIWQARYYLQTGLSEQAESSLAQSEMLIQKQVLRSLDTRLTRAFLYLTKAWAAFPKNKLASLEFANESRRLAKASGDLLWEGNAANHMGLAYDVLGNYEMAQKSYNEAITLYRRVNAPFRVARTIINLGQVARNRMDYKRSETLLKESIALSRSQNAWQLEADALEQLGSLKLFLGEFEQGAGYLQQAIEALWKSNYLSTLAIFLAELGSAYTLSGHFTQARQSLDRSIALIDTVDHPAERQSILCFETVSSIWQGQYEAARKSATKVFAFFENKDLFLLPQILNGPYALQGWIALSESDFDSAKENLQKQIGDAERHLGEANIVREWLAIYHATLSLAEWKLNEKRIAYKRIFGALATAVKIRAFITLLHVLPILPVLLAEESDEQRKIRGIEIYALAHSHPFIANSPFFYDIAGRHMEAVEAELPADIVATAKARGKALDFWPTAEQLLEELKEMGWDEA